MAQVLNEIFQLTEIKRSTFDFNDFRCWLALWLLYRDGKCCARAFALHHFASTLVGIVFTNSPSGVNYNLFVILGLLVSLALGLLQEAIFSAEILLMSLPGVVREVKVKIGPSPRPPLLLIKSSC
jgi:hypothetical protein